MPELRFLEDKTLAQAHRIEEILRGLEGDRAGDEDAAADQDWGEEEDRAGAENGASDTGDRAAGGMGESGEG